MSNSTPTEVDARPDKLRMVDAEDISIPTMGTGSCKLCSCPGFVPSQGGATCVNQNAQGGTCNHYVYEHN
jgi:hypothetical protein